MTRPADLEIVNDQVCQWTGTGRERMQDHYAGTGKARGRKRRQVIPACSDPECNQPAFAESPLSEKGKP